MRNHFEAIKIFVSIKEEPSDSIELKQTKIIIKEILKKMDDVMVTDGLKNN